MWGLGLVMLSLLTIVIIGVISNISLTNQQDYYGVKQTSEAATYDSKYEVAYIKGICVCGQDKGTNIKYSYLESVDLGDYKWKNTNAVAGSEGSPYTVSLVDENGNCQSPNPNYTKCEARIGEYVIDPDVFTESVIARLGSIIKPSEVYDIKVQEVIPYPPKISVYISYHQALNNGGDAINAEIPNQIDAVIEDTGSQAVIEYKHNNLPEFSASCVKEYCYMDEQEWKYCDSNDEQTCKNSGFTKKVEVTSSLVCGNACFCRDNGLDCGYYAKDKSWTGWKQVDSSKCKNTSMCYRKYTNKANDEYELKWSSSSPGSGWEETSISKENCRMACFVKTENGRKKYSWNGWGQWAGWTEDTSITSADKCKATSTSQNGGGGNCKWFYTISTPHQCKDGSGGTVMKYSGGSSGFDYTTSSDALRACKIAACGSVDKYAGGCTALKGYDYKINADSNKLHRNESSDNWCSGKNYYSCSCVNRKS